MSASTRDVIIVGAGLGSLTCAVELARHGLDVLVLEQHKVPGGYAHGFKRRGFSFDVSLHHVGGLDPGSLTHGLLVSLGVYDRLDLHRRSTLFRSEFPGFEVVLPNGGVEVTKALQELFPRERQGILELFRYLLRLKNDVFGPTMNPNYDVPVPERLSTEAADKTFLQVVTRYVSDPKLLALLGQLWQYIGLPPSRSTANFSTCVFCSTFLEGAYHLRGGGQSLAQALVDRLEELGGECRLRSRVSSIVTEGGLARGVELEGGERIASRLVISGANPFTTFFELIADDAVSQVYRYRLKQMECSLSAYSLYLGLDCAPSEIGIEQDNFFYNHALDYDDAYRRALAHEIDRTDWCLTSYASSDPGTAPPGGSVVSIAEVTPVRDWLDLTKEAYREEKQRVREVLRRKVFRRFPEMEKHVVVEDFATPRTMVRYTSNYQGAIYGFAQTVEQSNSKRLRNRSPLRNLWLTGAWTWAGGGYEGAMMAGAQTAAAVLAEVEAPHRAPPLQMHQPPGVPSVAEQLAALANEGSAASASGRYHVRARVYGADVGLYEQLDPSSVLRLMDRGRVEAIEQLSRASGSRSWLDQYTVNVYRLDAKLSAPATVGDELLVETTIMARSSHRAAFDHLVSRVDTGAEVARATVEVTFLGPSGTLAPVPPEIAEGAGTSRDPLVPVTWHPVPKRRMRPAWRERYRVYFEDTDTQSIAYHVTYVRFGERALIDRLVDFLPKGSIRSWLDEHRVVVEGLAVRFLNSAVLGDWIEVRGRIVRGEEPGQASLEAALVRQGEPEVVTADLRLELRLTDRSGRPVEIPSGLVDGEDNGMED